MKLGGVQKVWVLLRLALAEVFLWAFLDKVFGWGFATAANKSWLLGNSPTLGFLKFGTSGPLAGFYQTLAGNPIVDWLFMMGLLLVGLGLLSGIMIRLTCWGGALLMFLIYLAAWPPKNNPLIDEHIVYIFVLVGLNIVSAGEWWGWGSWWSQTALVKKHSWLK